MSAPPPPPTLNYVLGYVLVGLAWGLTTPFIRRAARAHRRRPHAVLDAPAVRASRWRARACAAFFAAADLLRSPCYAVPLLLNLTGSVWFFLLIGKAGASDRGLEKVGRRRRVLADGPAPPWQS